jgi:TolB-like protein/DNA-binding winged helix-turn-helix (wHTH) protein
MTYAASAHPANGSTGRSDDAGGAGSVWTVGPWRIDAGAGELRRGRESLRVEPKVAEVLVYLARRAGQVVSRDELLTAVWPGVVVGDDALTQAIIKLRKALDDDARRPVYIETLAKRGYRLIAPVARVTEAGGAPPAAPPAAAAEGTASPPTAAPSPAAASPARRRPSRLAVLGCGLAALAIAAGLAVGIYRDSPWPIGSESTARATAETLPVVAVLPLTNQSGDPRREFFSDGVTDDIIHALGRYSGLRVISSNSVQQFKQRKATPQIVRDELGARYVVTGGVREADGQLRVAVELSDAQTARVLWSERFDRDGKGVFEVQDSIVQSVVGALAIKVTKLESERAATRPPSRLEAYDLVLLARSLEARSERAANRRGRALIAKARELAPDYAMVYVVESELEVQRADQGWMEDPAQGLALAERAARHALTIDDPGANARAHAQLARIHAFRGEYDQALAESDRAIALNPSDTFIAEVRGQTLLWLGRFEEAITLLESARRLDPVGRSSPVRHVIVGAYFASERYPEALAACERGLADHPNLTLLHAMRAAVLAQLGRLEEARQSAAEVRRLQPNFPVAELGGRFVDPAPRERLQAALRKAGL